MIDLRGSRFTSILSEHLRNRETEALAYAVGRQVDKLLALADEVPFYAVLSKAPESVLDCLAAELRTPAYREAFPLEVKRALIRDSLLAYAKMGTPSAINRTIQSIFGYGHIEEWFDYDGEPHHFRAVIGQEDDGVDQTQVEEFTRLLGDVKRLSSWLDQMVVAIRRAYRYELPFRFGGAAGTVLKGDTDSGGQFQTRIPAAYGAFASAGLVGPPPETERRGTGAARAVPGVFSHSLIRPKRVDE